MNDVHTYGDGTCSTTHWDHKYREKWLHNNLFGYNRYCYLFSIPRLKRIFTKKLNPTPLVGSIIQ